MKKLSTRVPKLLQKKVQVKSHHSHFSIALACERGPIPNPALGLQLKQHGDNQHTIEAERSSYVAVYHKYYHRKGSFEKREIHEVVSFHKTEIFAKALQWNKRRRVW